MYQVKNVTPGVYDLVVSKSGCLDYTIKNVVVTADGVDLTSHSNPAIKNITLLCGDINDDGWINSTDLGIILQGQNYGKQTSVSGTNSLTDLNGDGWINSTDLGIVLQGQHYGKGTAACSPDY